ncbi:hypothetical protein LQ757_04245 [Agromyces sp. SYSU K20354]|uniref:hypothetical protein n=1 Tax=Agromyces cavernae TaxID=2898659 RepID=UPI001E2F254C|nr:hypothetical protein [Agromyces cavernae]MCD2441483.1 hypothetical protein [Agromyces cavernae]
MPTSRLKRRRSRRLGGAAAAASVLALVLTGCVGAAEPTPTPTPTEAAPIFASDEEALAAAEQAYAAQLVVVDELSHAGGVAIEKLEEVATAEYAAGISASLERLSASGMRTTGATTFDTVELIEHFEADDVAHVSAYVCLDIGDTRVVDSSGADVTPPDRILRAPLQVRFESRFLGANQLLVAGTEPWSGDDFC